MRYNPETERGITFDALVEESRSIINNIAREEVLQWRQVWDCHNGGWVTRQEFVTVKS